MSVKTVSREEARQLAAQCAQLLRDRFGATKVVLFGSAAGDAPWHSRSDIDLAVAGLDAAAHVQALNACYELLPPGLSLDLIPLESAWPQLLARIEGEWSMPDSPHEALAVEIENEMVRLRQVAARLEQFVQNAPAAPDEIQIQGGAKYLHDFYNGVERIFERIAVRVDEDVPAGANWHTLLLQRMARPFGEKRPAVINRELETTLANYLRFRRLFRHTYGYDLQWPPVHDLSQNLVHVLPDLQRQLDTFLAAVSGKNNAPPHDPDE